MLVFAAWPKLFCSRVEVHRESRLCVRSYFYCVIGGRFCGVLFLGFVLNSTKHFSCSSRPAFFPWYIHTGCGSKIYNNFLNFFFGLISPIFEKTRKHLNAQD